MRLPHLPRATGAPTGDDVLDVAEAQRLQQLERMQTLSDLLARCLTLESVCAVVLADGLAVFDADAGAIALVDGDDLEVAAAVGYDPDLVGRLSRFPVAADLMLARAVREGTAVFTRSTEDRDEIAPTLAGVDTGYTATASLPLIVRGTVIGALGLSFRDSPPVGIADGMLLNALAQQCALAVERAQLYDVELRLRAEAEAARREMALLQEVGSSLVAELDLQRILQTTTDAATQLSGAQFGAFFYNVVADGDESYQLYTLSGAERSAFDRFGMPRNTAVFAPTFSGERVIRLDDVTTDDRYGRNAPHRGVPDGHLPVRSYLAVPVRSRSGEVLGGLFFGHEEPGVFSERVERVVVGVAAQAATAIDNARLYEAEQRARLAADAASERLSFVAEATELLASSLDYDVTLQQLTDLLVPRLADGAAIMVGDAESLRVVAVAHVDPDGAAAMRRLAERETARPDNFYLQTARTGQPIVVLDVDPAVLESLAEDDDHLADMRRLSYRSAMTVPMAVGGRVVGVVTMSTGPSDRRYDDASVTLASDLARRAAVAVDNAITYRRQREVAVTLQRSLLPDQLPALPSVELDAAYVPGTAGTEVGGDWYDVIPLPGERVGLVIGDVMGRGVRAAAVMGQLRAVVRGYAIEDHEPAQLLSHLDRVVQTLEMQLVTCTYAVYDPVTRELSVASAGHLPPLQVVDGVADYLVVDPGLPLGVGGGDYRNATFALPPSACVLLYTDGLVEARGVSISDGMERLRRTAAAIDLEDVASPCAEILRRLGRESDHDDDTALLAMCTNDDQPLPGRRAAHVQLVQATTSVAQARAFVVRTLRDWDLERLTETAVLLVSELVTNAIVHAQSTVHVWLVADDAQLRVDVVDASARPVEPRLRLSATAEGGRGLFLVETMATDWGSESTPTGKRVWFVLDC